jgi:tyrosyl-tRNA synthetase
MVYLTKLIAFTITGCNFYQFIYNNFMTNSFLSDLSWRGLIYHATPGIEKVFEKGTTLYLGIDPTADSLHIGHLLAFLVLKRAYDAGNKIIVLVGGGTSKIGDPSGKEEERLVLSKEELKKNKEKLKAQLGRFFHVDGEKVKIVDNADWLEKLKLIEFLRDIGKYISTNSMLDLESVKTRLTRQQGISYAEFSYQILQAYDFLKLFETYNCEIQIGGSDQLGNIIQGVELIRKKLGKQSFGLALPLIVNPKTGKKFGKTEKGASIWLDPKKTHPFAFYQFLINTDDNLIPTLVKYYSFKSRQEIELLIKKWTENKQARLLQKELASELTEIIHGKEIADQCKKVTEILFDKRGSELNKEDLEFIKNAIPNKKIPSEKDFALEQILVDLGLVSSKSEARRLIEQKGISHEKLFGKYFLIRKGRREWGMVEVG